MKRLRAYHAVLAVTAILAFATGEMGLVHAWLGYGVAAVILFRLGLAVTGETQLGLMRFYPRFEGLKFNNVFTHPAVSRTLLFAIALSLVGVTATGIVIDRGQTIGLAATDVTAPAAKHEGSFASGDREESGGDENPLEELHETLANFLMLLVGSHVTYLLIFKRPLAKYMLFLSTRGSQKKTAERK